MTDPLADLRGPDGDLGTNADDAERILDARDAAAEVPDDGAYPATASRATPEVGALAPTVPRADGTSRSASSPDWSYIAQRRRRRVEDLLDALPQHHGGPRIDELTRAVRAYLDVARVLEVDPADEVAREAIPDGRYGGAREPS